MSKRCYRLNAYKPYTTNARVRARYVAAAILEHTPEKIHFHRLLEEMEEDCPEIRHVKFSTLCTAARAAAKRLGRKIVGPEGDEYVLPAEGSGEEE